MGITIGRPANNDVRFALTTGQIEVLLRAGREYNCIPEELIKLSESSLADGVIDHQEASSLLSWLSKDAEQRDNPITRILLHRVSDMLSDGKFDDEERVELFHLLGCLHGNNEATATDGMSSPLPLCNPPPDVIFPGKGFCCTGQFAYGPRWICHEEIEKRGGTIEKRINWRVDYLVVGTLCTEAWAHSSYGRKIEEAVTLRSSGRKNIHIISEDHWANSAFKM